MAKIVEVDLFWYITAVDQIIAHHVFDVDEAMIRIFAEKWLLTFLPIPTTKEFNMYDSFFSYGNMI